MQIAIVLFENMTGLDAIGPYEVLSRVPGADLTFVSARPGPVRTDTTRLGLVADAAYEEVPHPDVVVVPGGFGQNDHREGSPLQAWLQEADKHTTWTTSVCTGSLILAAAGLLTGRPATTHWLAYDELRELGAVPSEQRVVVDGKYVTAGGSPRASTWPSPWRRTSWDRTSRRPSSSASSTTHSLRSTPAAPEPHPPGPSRRSASSSPSSSDPRFPRLRENTMHPQHSATSATAGLDVLVIGAGQAGLAVGWHLARTGLRYLMLDAAPELGTAGAPAGTR